MQRNQLKEFIVPLYYFDVYEGTMLMHDAEGFSYGSLDAAVQGAVRSAAEIGQCRQAKGDIGDVVIKVRDEHHQSIVTVTASMKVEWCDRHQPATRHVSYGQAPAWERP
jgi:hypothetical protein